MIKPTKIEDTRTGEIMYARPDVEETICNTCKNYETQCKEKWEEIEGYPTEMEECQDYERV